ncbi:ATP-binding SpoIIE family protein phosphatase [Jatrophihabitans sp. YIM 134969]
MTAPEPFVLLQLTLAQTDDATVLRHHARDAALGLELGDADATRVATAVSEIGRFGDHAVTTVTVATLDADGTTVLQITVGFDDPGWRERPGVERTLSAVTRLLDTLHADDDGVVVTKRAARRFDTLELTALRHRLLRHRPGDLGAVLQSQNAELLQVLARLRDREAELVRVNGELEQTNRGVVALYAELEQRAAEIRTAQRGVFVELERALRPLPLLVPGIALDVRYLPAQVNSPTGGDLYDWYVLPDGSVHVAVVDVMGHGVESTRDALRVTHTLRTLVQEGYALDTLLHRADELLQLPGHPLHATSVVVRLDPGGRLEVAGAGHPPVLLLTADGSVRYLEARGRPLGYPEAGSVETTVVQLAAGDGVLLYTDGLVEARHDIVEGMSTLETAAVKAGAMALPQLLDTVVAACLQGATMRDDTLLLGVRWHRADSRSREATGVSLPMTPEAASLARQYLLEQAADLSTETLDDALVMMSEVVGNAVRHGAAPVTLTLSRLEGGLRVEVYDAGAPFRHDTTVVPSVVPTSGRGLFLVAALSTDWGVDPADDGGPGKTVWFQI